MEDINTLKKEARKAGIFYFIMAVTGVYGIMYVPDSVIVPGDPAATAAKILGNELLFRSGILSNLLCQTTFIFLVLSLYKLLKDVNIWQARLMVGLVLVAVPIAYFIIFNQIFVLLLLKSEHMTAFEPAQLNAIAISYLRMYQYGISVIGIFWGLWLIPFGQLVYSSGFIPRILGILLIAGGTGYVIDAITFLMVPSLQMWSGIVVGVVSSVAEFSMVLWLLIVGVRTPGFASSK